jgi:hypothetical protein
MVRVTRVRARTLLRGVVSDAREPAPMVLFSCRRSRATARVKRRCCSTHHDSARPRHQLALRAPEDVARSQAAYVRVKLWDELRDATPCAFLDSGMIIIGAAFRF